MRAITEESVPSATSEGVISRTDTNFLDSGARKKKRTLLSSGVITDRLETHYVQKTQAE